MVISRILNRIWAKLLRTCIRIIEPRPYQQAQIRHFGSEYGGKHFSTAGLQTGGILRVISAGVGEDVSFDIDFLNHYSSKIIFVDPTPKSAIHMHGVLSHLGSARKMQYVNNGKQPVESYELSNVEYESIQFFEVALWNKNESVSFYPPKNPEHVSYSVGNLQSNSDYENLITVPAYTLRKVMQLAQLDGLEILKLDIEGAEHEVLKEAFKDLIFPDQIILEIDEFCFPSIRNLVRGFKVLSLLRKNGYRCAYNNQEYDYCFVRFPANI